MNFKQRVIRYMIGLGIGTLVVFMMFPDHDWLGWTPEKKVMEEIREANFMFSPMASCQMECLGINNEQIQLARQDGHIDFEKSKVKQQPRIYHLSYGNLNMNVSVGVAGAQLEEIINPAKECNCPS